MYYDKRDKLFYTNDLDRDEETVAAKLRLMAVRVEEKTLGCLTLNMLGDIFGNEFWNLIYHEPTCHLRRRRDDHVD